MLMQRKTPTQEVTLQDVAFPWAPILMYHRVVPEIDRPDPHGLCISVAAFESQVRYLYERGYRTVTLDEWVLTVCEGRPQSEPMAVITFDDGYRDVYDHALPVLRRYGASATLFLVSGCVGGTSTWDEAALPLLGLPELREMHAYGISFGSHSRSHAHLAGLPEEEAREEIILSKVELERALETEIRSFCFPYGQATPVVRQMVQEAGYSAACGIDQPLHALFNLTRIDAAHHPGTGLPWRLRASGAHHRLRNNKAVRLVRDFRR